MATEEILMRAVKAGADRQQAHERIRRHSLAAKEALLAGGENDLIDRLRADPAFAAVRGEIEAMLAPERFSGLAERQTRTFLRDEVEPRIARWRGRIAERAELRV